MFVSFDFGAEKIKDFDSFVGIKNQRFFNDLFNFLGSKHEMFESHEN